MAMITSFKTIEERLKPKKIIEDPVDMNILEYFYAATMNDILSDDNLIRLINKNGFYKTSFLDAFDLDEITITIGTENVTWIASPVKMKNSNLQIFKHLNKKENINDIHKYVSNKYALNTGVIPSKSDIILIESGLLSKI